MQVRIRGCRGSLPSPGPKTTRYGGNTSCVEIRADDGGVVVLDAGSGIRAVGDELPRGLRKVDLLLTHLHLDHVEGLGFFAPLHDPECCVTIWGPPQEGASLEQRLATWLSPPFYPLRFGELPARIEVVEVRDETWRLGGLAVACTPVQHPGPTLGYRIEDAGSSLAYVPDNERGLAPASGTELAAGVDTLLHDAQYTSEEYETRRGWGHSSLADFASLVGEAEPVRALMFHHDPAHDDAALEAMLREAEAAAGRPVELASEGSIL